MSRVWYDYQNQAWVENGRYARCGHVKACVCYGRLHEGEKAKAGGSEGGNRKLSPEGAKGRMREMIDIKAVRKGIEMLIADQVKALSADKADDPCAAAHRGQIRAYQHVLFILSALAEAEEPTAPSPRACCREHWQAGQWDDAGRCPECGAALLLE